MLDKARNDDVIKQKKLHQKIRRSASEWRGIISDYKTSELTQREFCLQRGVAYSSLPMPLRVSSLACKS